MWRGYQPTFLHFKMGKCHAKCHAMTVDKSDGISKFNLHFFSVNENVTSLPDTGRSIVSPFEKSLIYIRRLKSVSFFKRTDFGWLESVHF